MCVCKIEKREERRKKDLFLQLCLSPSFYPIAITSTHFPPLSLSLFRIPHRHNKIFTCSKTTTTTSTTTHYLSSPVSSPTGDASIDAVIRAFHSSYYSKCPSVLFSIRTSSIVVVRRRIVVVVIIGIPRGRFHIHRGPLES